MEQLVNLDLGAKKCYIVHLARSKSKYEHQDDLLAALEDLKYKIENNEIKNFGTLLEVKTICT